MLLGTIPELLLKLEQELHDGYQGRHRPQRSQANPLAVTREEVGEKRFIHNSPAAFNYVGWMA